MIQFDPSHHYDIIHYLTSHFPKFPFLIGIFETSSSRPQIHFLFFLNRFFFFSSNIISIFFNFWYIYSLIIILVPLVIILFPNSHFFHVFISFFNSMFSLFENEIVCMQLFSNSIQSIYMISDRCWSIYDYDFWH